MGNSASVATSPDVKPGTVSPAGSGVATDVVVQALKTHTDETTALKNELASLQETVRQLARSVKDSNTEKSTSLSAVIAAANAPLPLEKRDLKQLVEEAVQPVAQQVTQLKSILEAEFTEGRRELFDEAALTEYQDNVLQGCPLKSDHFAGVHKLKDPPILPGICNLRKVEGKPIYGIFQAEAEGIGRVVDWLLEPERGHKRVVWVNLREEPVVFVNGHPVSPREPGLMNDNITYLFGIKGFELERMEARLKLDIWDHAQKNGGKIGIFHQRLDMTNEEKMVEVSSLESIQTLREVYTDLRKKGRNVHYTRIPIQDECAPEEKDFTDIVEILRQSRVGETAFVFNCQMGRGRTTTGMVCACLLYRFLTRKEADISFNDTPSAFTFGAGGTFRSIEALAEPGAGDLARGEYKAIQDLVLSLPSDGLHIKRQVDDAIDECGHLQNLRAAILDCKVQADKAAASGAAAEGRGPEFWLVRGRNYLERYWYLIVFNAYLNYSGPHGFSQSFTMWIRERWALKRMLKRLYLE